MTTDIAEDRAPARPPVVSAEEWQQERDDLMVAEKEATRALDRLAARRRRLPMVRVRRVVRRSREVTAAGSLLDLFEGRHQLAVYQFMDVGPDAFCPGCTWLTKNVTALRDLAANGVSWATVSHMPLAQMQGYWAEQGWDVPFYSSRGTTFAADCGVGRRVHAQHLPPRRRRGLPHLHTTRAAWTASCSSTTCSTSRRTGGRRTGRTHPTAGHSNRPTGRSDRESRLPARGGSSPVRPSTASRSRSACPVCRPYSSSRSSRSRRRLAWWPSPSAAAISGRDRRRRPAAAATRSRARATAPS